MNEDYHYETGYSDACKMIIQWMLNNQGTFDSWEIFCHKLLSHVTIMKQEQEKIIQDLEEE